MPNHTDTERLDYLESAIRKAEKSYGVPLGAWVANDGDLFILGADIGEPHPTIREAIDAALEEDDAK